MKIHRLVENAPRQIIAESMSDAPSNAVCVSVGDSIENFEENTLRGHGTLVRDDTLVATVCGVVERVNKLITVKTLHRRYGAEVGDVVVGRVTEIGGKRWRIDLQAKQEAQLMLSAVSLPGGIQRRRTAEDELQMREIFKEGDLVSAEVQAVHQDGVVLLHTRSTRYGLLKHGQLVEVSACLVKRQRQHMATFDEYGVGIILGCNGLIWVGIPSTDAVGDSADADIDDASLLESIARIAQSIKVLSRMQMMISTESIGQTARLSLEHGIHASEMGRGDFLKILWQHKESNTVKKKSR